MHDVASGLYPSSLKWLQAGGCIVYSRSHLMRCGNTLKTKQAHLHAMLVTNSDVIQDLATTSRNPYNFIRSMERDS